MLIEPVSALPSISPFWNPDTRSSTRIV